MQRHIGSNWIKTQSHQWDQWSLSHQLKCNHCKFHFKCIHQIAKINKRSGTCVPQSKAFQLLWRHTMIENSWCSRLLWLPPCWWGAHPQELSTLWQPSQWMCQILLCHFGPTQSSSSASSQSHHDQVSDCIARQHCWHAQWKMHHHTAKQWCSIVIII